MHNTGIIILAAGSSSRLGSIKQLLSFNNKTLLQHAIDEAVEAGASPVVVVTGANASRVSAFIDNKMIDIVFNKDWEQGMASGIVTGLQKAIALKHDLANIIIAVCDQPFVSASLFEQLYQEQHNSTKHIVASAYADTIGTPALFTQKYFESLMNLQGDEGARKILKAHREDVAAITFPQGHIDIDTKKDYADLLKTKKNW